MLPRTPQFTWKFTIFLIIAFAANFFIWPVSKKTNAADYLCSSAGAEAYAITTDSELEIIWNSLFVVYGNSANWRVNLYLRKSIPFGSNGSGCATEITNVSAIASNLLRADSFTTLSIPFMKFAYNFSLCTSAFIFLSSSKTITDGVDSDYAFNLCSLPTVLPFIPTLRTRSQNLLQYCHSLDPTVKNIQTDEDLAYMRQWISLLDGSYYYVWIGASKNYSFTTQNQSGCATLSQIDAMKQIVYDDKTSALFTNLNDVVFTSCNNDRVAYDRGTNKLADVYTAVYNNLSTGFCHIPPDPFSKLTLRDGQLFIDQALSSSFWSNLTVYSNVSGVSVVSYSSACQDFKLIANGANGVCQLLVGAAGPVINGCRIFMLHVH